MIDLPIQWALLAQANGAENATKDGGASAGMQLLMLIGFVAFMAAPFVIGWMISQAIRLKDTSFRIGLVLFTAMLGLAPFAWKIAEGKSWKDAIDFGIDLAGGANLVFKINVEAAKEQGKELTPELMGRMIGAISRRLDPAAQEQITVRQVGADRIEVIIPGADRETVERKKREMTRLGSLEFAILANYRDHRGIIETALKSPDHNIRQGEDRRIVASWREAGWENVGGKRVQKDIDTRGEVASRTVKRDGQDIAEFLCIMEPPDRQVTGQYLTRAYQTFDDNGRLAVGFNFNAKGATLFSSLTGRNLPKPDGFESRLAILLDEQVQSAPSLLGRIEDRGDITGNFTQEEINELINVLNAGALAVPIVQVPISEQTISPTLGIDVQQKGLNAILFSSVLVFIFMVLYYRFAGVVADISLVLNMILLLGAMSLIDASFTLPGLAGIALTIGMAVDANVLVFERIREESAKGSSLRLAIHNGFHRALPAIIDSNVTTLITAVILYMIGTDQVRGFAVSLFIGIVMSMFSALYLGRLILEICERKRWITQLKMFSLVGQTNWDFIGKRYICAALSTLVIGGGLVMFFFRGTDNLDIDLSGGTMVTFQFNEPQKVNDVRNDLQKVITTGISLEQLTLLGEEQTADAGKRFRVRTKEQDIATVRNQVSEALKSRPLHRVTVEFGNVSPIAAAPSSEAGQAEKEGADAAKAASDTSASALSENDRKFAGGHQVALTFSDGIRQSTIEDYLISELRKIPSGTDLPKYDEPLTLFALDGEALPQQEGGSSSGKTFQKAVLKTSPALTEADLKTALASLQSTMATYPVFDEVNSFESSIAAGMQRSAVLAMFWSLIAIVAYLWFRFDYVTFGLATITAVVHDVLLCLGMIAVGAYLSRVPGVGAALGLEDFKINMEIVAAFMTIAGYSLNDTIVVFDRLREVRGKNPALTADMINLSLNQTLSRTILTSWTVFMVVVILYAMGGEGIHGFAYVLFVGMVTGVYSTIYVAAPALLWLMNRPGSATSRATSLAEAKATAAP